jgi:ribosomal protein S27E
MAPRFTEIECPNCGAPLRWEGEAPVVACHYCDTHVHTPTGSITQEPAVVRSQGRPAEATSSSSSSGAGKGGCIILLLVLGVNLAAGLVALIANMIDGGVSKVTGVSMESLAALDLGGDNAAVAAALGLTPDEDGDDLHVPLRGSGFDYAYLRWSEEAPRRVVGFNFYASEGHPELAAVLSSLEHSLGRRLEPARDGYRYWHWADAHINVALDGTHMGFQVDPEDDIHWQYRAKLLWTVALAAAQGQPMDLSGDVRRAWLAQGHALSKLGDLDLRYDTDGARAYVPSTFPGAHEEIFIDLSFTVPLDHPWFREIELSWPNEAGGTMEGASLRPPPGQQHLADQLAVKRCLDSALGQGERRVQDHLAGTWSASWQTPGGPWLNLSEYGVDIHLDRGSQQGGTEVKAKAWRRFVSALAACGG